MTTLISPLAGKPAPRSLLVDVPRLVTGYYTGLPAPFGPRNEKISPCFTLKLMLSTAFIEPYECSRLFTSMTFLVIDKSTPSLYRIRSLLSFILDPIIRSVNPIIRPPIYNGYGFSKQIVVTIEFG